MTDKLTWSNFDVDYPQILHPNDLITIYVDATLYDDGIIGPFIWDGKFVVTGEGYEQERKFTGVGEEIGPEGAEIFRPGRMPNYDVTYRIELWGEDWPKYFPPWPEWKRLSTKYITISPIKEGECVNNSDCAIGYECKNGVCVPIQEEEESEVPWKWITVGAGVVTALILLIPSDKKKKGTRR